MGRPLRRTRKLRALILLRSWRFSLLDILLYSSGLGRQSSGSRILSGKASFLGLSLFSLSGRGAFLMPPDMTVPLRDGLGFGTGGRSSSSGSPSSSSKSEAAFDVAGVSTSCGSMANMGECESVEEEAPGDAVGKS